ncbi:MAG: hypothetical protein N2651_03180, partial [Fimbriimonadales bacterium]|nr:hypothetical protein [Fimbriimonadales bacterium]
RWTPRGFRAGTRAFWVSDMDTTYVFDAQGQLVQQIPIGAGTSFTGGAIAFSPDRQWVVLRDGVRRVSNQQVALNRLIASALFTRDSRRMVAQNGFAVSVYDASNWQMLWETTDGGFPAFSADGTRLLLHRFVSSSFARVVDTDTGQLIWVAPSNLLVYRAQIAPNGRLVGIVYQGNEGISRLRVYDIDTNTIVLESPYDHVQQIVFSPNSRYLIASLGDGNTTVCHDLQTGQSLWEEGHRLPSNFSVEHFTPDSRYVVLKHSWGYPVVVNVATGSTVREFTGRPYELIAATYSDDGTRLALQYADTTVEVARHIPIEGDTNDDGCVDDADLLTVLFQFGQTSYGWSGDLNRDQRVDDADLLIVLFNFSSGC